MCQAEAYDTNISIWVLIYVLAASLPILLPAKGLGNTMEDNPNSWVTSIIHKEDPDEAPDFG